MMMLGDIVGDNYRQQRTEQFCSFGTRLGLEDCTATGMFPAGEHL